jgi:phosphatidylglycerophosphate synthase
MLDSHLRPYIDPPLNVAAKYLSKSGVTANVLTSVGFGFALCCFIALTFSLYDLAIIFIILNRLMDGLDGPVSRQTCSTDLGGYLDIVFDFIFYSGTIFFFALGAALSAGGETQHTALAAAFLIFSFMGTGSSFLAYAVVSAKRGENHEEQGKKSFFYAQGLAEGTETIIALLLICIFPENFVAIACVYGVLCWLTTIGRIGLACSNFKE